MSAIDTVNNFVTALDAGNFDVVEKSLDNNFFFGGWIPETLDKSQFLTLVRGLKAGIPNLSFNIHDLVEIRGTTTVQGTMQVTGTQTGTIDLSALRIPPVQPTGRSISLPPENVVFGVAINRITRMNVTPEPGGGLQGLLQQLGVQSPTLP
jgi:hypothetical protein